MKRKQYELLQRYPSLPDNWEKGHRVIKMQGTPPYVSCHEDMPGALKAEEVENHPNFWRRLPEKAYQILWYKHKKDKRGGAIAAREYAYMSTKRFYKPYSVQRLDDRKRFRVGDVVKAYIGHVLIHGPIVAIVEDKAYVDDLYVVVKTGEAEIPFALPAVQHVGKNEYKITKVCSKSGIESVSELTPSFVQKMLDRGYLVHAIQFLKDGRTLEIGDTIRMINCKKESRINSFISEIGVDEKDQLKVVSDTGTIYSVVEKIDNPKTNTLMAEDPYKNRDHLGDGLYVHYTGHSYELSVNHHKNPPVAVLDDCAIDALNRFRKRMEENNK